jgi:hypothetical protein
MRWLHFFLLTAGIAVADEIDLTDGTKLNADVTSYSNLTFHVIHSDGKPAKQPAAYVKRITFADRGRASTFDLRTGQVTGKLVRYENNTFHYEDAQAQSNRLASVLVRALHAPFASPASDNGEANDALDIPDALSHGAAIELTELIVAGKVTLVFFFGNVNQPGIQCRLMNNFLDNVIRADPRIAIRKVDIGEWDSPVAQQYKVTALPRVDVYDSTGKLAQSIVGNRAPELGSILKRIR